MCETTIDDEASLEMSKAIKILQTLSKKIESVYGHQPILSLKEEMFYLTVNSTNLPEKNKREEIEKLFSIDEKHHGLICHLEFRFF